MEVQDEVISTIGFWLHLFSWLADDAFLLYPNMAFFLHV